MTFAEPTRISVIRTHLELRSPAELRPARTPDELPVLELRRPIRAAEYRALYSLVGERWLWRDRLAWTDAELDAYLSSPLVQVWVARFGGAVAGYFELRLTADDAVEIVYFGLAPAYIGRGLGGWLLTRAVEIALAPGARRVELNTCTLDGPHALPNYLARGFRIVGTESYQTDLPRA